MNFLITVMLAVCIGLFVAFFISFVWTCVVLIAKAVAKERVTANMDMHIFWLGMLSFAIFLLSNIQ